MDPHFLNGAQDGSGRGRGMGRGRGGPPGPRYGIIYIAYTLIFKCETTVITVTVFQR